MGKRVRIVLFDMDGVLVKIRSSWEYLHQYFGVEDRARSIMKAFEKGEFDYIEWMKLDTGLWIERAGKIHVSELIEILGKVPINDDAKTIAVELHKRGILVGIVSGGIDLLARRVAREIGADVWLANKLLFDKRGYLLPGGAPIVGVDKSRVMRRILGEYGIPRDKAMFVGDSRWDATAMRIIGYPVVYGESCPILLEIAKCKIKRLREVIDLVEEIERLGDCPNFKN